MQQKEKRQILHILIWTAGMSVWLVFLFLFLIQWDYLRAERVVVSGAGRLSEPMVLEKAGLSPGVNIFSVNLSKARKRLLSHPWIAEAAVGIWFPPEIRIRIKEYEALAVFELDQKYLANRDGKIFKEWDPLETRILPVVSGLRY
ncbi:MAG: cell division protein FtsQ/DivIB, partial [Thermodesulfobacteriota bacterium]